VPGCVGGAAPAASASQASDGRESTSPLVVGLVEGPLPVIDLANASAERLGDLELAGRDETRRLVGTAQQLGPDGAAVLRAVEAAVADAMQAAADDVDAQLTGATDLMLVAS